MFPLVVLGLAQFLFAMVHVDMTTMTWNYIFICDSELRMRATQSAAKLFCGIISLTSRSQDLDRWVTSKTNPTSAQEKSNYMNIYGFIKKMFEYLFDVEEYCTGSVFPS